MRQEQGLLDVVVSQCKLLGQVLYFDLTLEDGGALPAWEAGAHIDLHLQDGLIRQYSLCGNPEDTTQYVLGVLLDPNSRGGSIAVHKQIAAGGELKISYPRNLFPLDNTAKNTVLIGGGIGITPMIAMAYSLYARSAPFHLHYVARDPVFAPLLQTLPFAQHVSIYNHGDTASQRFDIQNVLQAAQLNGGRDVHAYVCGPEGLMKAVEEVGLCCGYPLNTLHQEAFSGQPVAGGNSFEVLAAKSGVRVQVAEDESITTALARHGVRVPVSCEQGICGTCVVSVLEGTADHKDEYLTDEEKTDQIALCCSRSQTPLLVIDL